MARPKKASKNEGNSIAPKAKGLFDHLNHLRQVQDPKYFETLTDADKKSWTNYMVCRFLSMQPELVENIAEISVFWEQPPERFYQILLLIMPAPAKAYFPYIKSKKAKRPKELMELLRKHFEESERNVEEYLDLMSAEQVRKIVGLYGFTEKEIEKLINHAA